MRFCTKSERVIYSFMRYGFTTGSCSAAAAKAATYMLLSGKEKQNIVITTPKGIDYETEILSVTKGADFVSCGVIKDGGDDPDITTGAIVFSCVRMVSPEGNRIVIDGGEGVGRVTKPGLDQPVGNAAINSVPRLMIEKEVREVMELFDFTGTLEVIVSVPGGEKIADKTFNPRLGIEGGISVLGTSGIVEPMSSRALLDTIFVELKQKRELGREMVVIAPGNYGMEFMARHYSYDLDKAVKCSNYIGETLDMIADLGYRKVLLCGHIGKLIKVSGGIMNTHSKEADCRMELMAFSALQAGADLECLRQIADCISTDAAYEVIKNRGLEKDFMKSVTERIDFYLNKRAAGRFEIGCIVYSNEQGLMGETKEAASLLEAAKKDE